MAIQNSLVEPKIPNPKPSYLRLFIAKHLKHREILLGVS
jgi:hypothetical protein